MECWNFVSLIKLGVKVSEGNKIIKTIDWVKVTEVGETFLERCGCLIRPQLKILCLEQNTVH